MKNTSKSKFVFQVAVFYFTLAGFCQSIHAQAETRFRLVHDTVVVVSLMANDQGPFDFVFDTGTNTTLIDSQVAQRLGLSAVDRIQLLSVGGVQTVVRSSFRALSLGSASGSNVEVLIEDMSAMRKVDSHIVGILGQNFLGQLNYLIDYKRRSIRIEQADEIRTAVAGDRTQVEMSEGLMLVPSELQTRNRAKMRLLLDSGANLLTLFHTASLDVQQTAMDGGWTSNTGNQENETRTTRLKVLAVGAQQFRNIIAGLPSAVDERERIEDGSLPLALFHSIYVNNGEHFVIFNPELNGTRGAGTGSEQIATNSKLP